MGVNYADTEVVIIRRGFATQKTNAQISEMLKRCGYERSPESVGGKLIALGLIRHTDRILAQKTYANHCDLAFKRAMLAAIKSGEEKAFIGVIKDYRPLRATTFQPEPKSSGCSSSAAECAAIGTGLGAF